MNFTLNTTHKLAIKICALCCILLMVTLPANAQKRKKGKADTETTEWRYEMESVGVGSQGSAQLKVWSYSKFPETAKEQSKKNAIHGVCFRGYQGDGRVQGKDKMVTAENELKFEKFFTAFFKDGGEYLRFVQFTGDGEIGMGDLIKVGKKEFKVGVVVKVDFPGLRAYFEEQGIVAKLGGRF